jgi:hypothetical protein
VSDLGEPLDSRIRIHGTGWQYGGENRDLYPVEEILDLLSTVTHTDRTMDQVIYVYCQPIYRKNEFSFQHPTPLDWTSVCLVSIISSPSPISL